MSGILTDHTYFFSGFLGVTQTSLVTLLSKIRVDIEGDIPVNPLQLDLPMAPGVTTPTVDARTLSVFLEAAVHEEGMINILLLRVIRTLR